MRSEVILVTGGTSGIGKAICTKFAKEGYHVATCARTKDKVESLSNELGSEHIVKVCDVRDKESISMFFDNVIERFGRLDILINNAGVFIPGRIQDETDEVFTTMMETNLNASYTFSKLSIPHLKASGNGQLFSICSTASITPYPNGGTYCISKYAQYGMTKVLREELKEDGVKVTAVLPGATYTPSWEGTDLPENRFMAASTIAKMIYDVSQLPAETVVEDLLVRPMLGDIN